MRHSFIAILMLSVLFLAVNDIARAASHVFTATVAFDSGPAVNKVSDMNFGTVQSQTAGVYIMNTSGNINDVQGGVFLHGPTSVAEADIMGSSIQTVDITSANYVSDQGVDIISLRCRYDGGLERNCDTMLNMPAPGAGKQLLIGARIEVDGSQAAGVTANPTFDIVATYH